MLNPKKKLRFKHSLFTTSPSNSNPVHPVIVPHLGSAFGTPQVHTKTITSDAKLLRFPQWLEIFNDLIYGSDTVDGRNPINSPVEVGSVSHFFRGFLHSWNFKLQSPSIRGQFQVVRLVLFKKISTPELKFQLEHFPGEKFHSSWWFQPL